MEDWKTKNNNITKFQKELNDLELKDDYKYYTYIGIPYVEFKHDGPILINKVTFTVEVLGKKITIYDNFTDLKENHLIKQQEFTIVKGDADFEFSLDPFTGKYRISRKQETGLGEFKNEDINNRALFYCKSAGFFTTFHIKCKKYTEINSNYCYIGELEFIYNPSAGTMVLDSEITIEDSGYNMKIYDENKYLTIDSNLGVYNNLEWEKLGFINNYSTLKKNYISYTKSNLIQSYSVSMPNILWKIGINGSADNSFIQYKYNQSNNDRQYYYISGESDNNKTKINLDLRFIEKPLTLWSTGMLLGNNELVWSTPAGQEDHATIWMIRGSDWTYSTDPLNNGFPFYDVIGKKVIHDIGSINPNDLKNFYRLNVDWKSGGNRDRFAYARYLAYMLKHMIVELGYPGLCFLNDFDLGSTTLINAITDKYHILNTFHIFDTSNLDNLKYLYNDKILETESLKINNIKPNGVYPKFVIFSTSGNLGHVDFEGTNISPVTYETSKWDYVKIFNICQSESLLFLSPTSDYSIIPTVNNYQDCSSVTESYSISVNGFGEDGTETKQCCFVGVYPNAYLKAYRPSTKFKQNGDYKIITNLYFSGSSATGESIHKACFKGDIEAVRPEDWEKVVEWYNNTVPTETKSTLKASIEADMQSRTPHGSVVKLEPNTIYVLNCLTADTSRKISLKIKAAQEPAITTITAGGKGRKPGGSSENLNSSIINKSLYLGNNTIVFKTKSSLLTIAGYTPELILFKESDNPYMYSWGLYKYTRNGGLLDSGNLADVNFPSVVCYHELLKLIGEDLDYRTPCIDPFYQCIGYYKIDLENNLAKYEDNSYLIICSDVDAKDLKADKLKNYIDGSKTIIKITKS